MGSYGIPVSYTIIFWQWTNYNANIDLESTFWLTDWLIDWLIDWFIFYFAINIAPFGANLTTNSHFHFHFWAGKLKGTFTLRCTGSLTASFSSSSESISYSKSFYSVIIDIHCLLCTIRKLPPLIISSSAPFWHGKKKQIRLQILGEVQLFQLILGI